MDEIVTADKSAHEIIKDIHAAAIVEAGVSEKHVYGPAGEPFDRRSPFYIGLMGALGVAFALALVWAVIAVAQILVLIVLSLLIAVGLEPAVVWIHHRGFPRWLAVCIVIGVALAAFAGFLALAVPVLVKQTTVLANEIPHYLDQLQNHSSALGKLSTRFHLASRLQSLLKNGGSATLASGAFGVGKAVLNFLFSAVIVIILSIYLLVDLPRVKRGLYQFAPRSRRARTILLTNEIMSRVGGYVLGNLLTSLIAGVLTYIWASSLNIPYALLLSLLVGVLDLIPIVGSTIGGAIAALLALTVSPVAAIATVIFFLIYRFLEDYLLTPKIMARTVQVPGLLTVIATIIGGALLGIIGALIAIPIAAAIKLLLEEMAVPSLERH